MTMKMIWTKFIWVILNKKFKHKNVKYSYQICFPSIMKFNIAWCIQLPFSPLFPINAYLMDSSETIVDTYIVLSLYKMSGF